MARSADLTGAVRFLRGALWTSAGFGLLFVGLGAVLMAADAGSHDDAWDGLGLFLGTFMVAAGGLWLLPHAGLAVGLARAVRRGRSPKPVAVASTLLGAALVLLGIYVASSGAARLSTMTPEIGVSLLVLAAGFAVLADSEQRSTAG
jgi:hypothetical protein